MNFVSFDYASFEVLAGFSAAAVVANAVAAGCAVDSDSASHDAVDAAEDSPSLVVGCCAVDASVGAGCDAAVLGTDFVATPSSAPLPSFYAAPP